MQKNDQEELPRILYGFWLSPYMSIVAHLLKESGLDFQYERVSPYLGATHSDEHKKINPLAKIPSLRDSNAAQLSDSQAICRYLARSYPQAREFYPCDDALKCAAVDEKNDFITFSISGPFFNWFVVGGYFPQAFRMKTEKESHIFSMWSVFLVRSALNRLIVGSKMAPFLLGSSPTLADFQLFYILELGRVFSKIFNMPILNLLESDKSLGKFYDAMLARQATSEVLEAQAGELELTERELFEEFGLAYEDILKEGRVALQHMFGHEV